ncbi:MAG: sulfate ABC transporter substrate-binding protein [Azospirillum sp.]|nr:sulfate ABC transporter substrate-binding protein [Azospirillum sp.]
MLTSSLAKLIATILVTAGVIGAAGVVKPTARLGISTWPSAESYAQYGALFAEEWGRGSDTEPVLHVSHSDPGRPMNPPGTPLDADVIHWIDGDGIDQMVAAGLVGSDWRDRLPFNSAPYTSTVAFLVRKGNRKGIVDWPDLTRPGTRVVMASPRTAAGARWTFLAAWGAALDRNSHDQAAARDFVARLVANIPVFQNSSRGAVVAFADHGVGDVLVGWEAEALAAQVEFGANRFEIVRPSLSILVEPPVAVVDAVADGHGSRKIAEAYTRFLFTRPAQELAARAHYRPRLAIPTLRGVPPLPPVAVFTVDRMFGGWAAVQARFFDEGGEFDQLLWRARS